MFGSHNSVSKKILALTTTLSLLIGQNILLFVSLGTLLYSSDAFAAPTDDFVITVKTDNPGTSGSTSFTIPTTGAGYNYDVDWDNNGSFEQTGITGDVTHNFGVAGTYTIRINGDFPRIYFHFNGDREKILTVEQWGTNPWTSMADAFSGAISLTVPATDVPDLSGVTDMSYMFNGATFLTGTNFNNWNTSNITTLENTFSNSGFNEDIGDWDTSSVTTLFNMFNTAWNFNQDIGGWDVSNVTTLRNMFSEATSFNQDLNLWDVSSVSNFRSVFSQATAFNGNISSWVTTSGTNMSRMFNDAANFNQDISGWDVTNVTSLQDMFFGATDFDQDLSGWDVSNVSVMDEIFNTSGLSCTNYGNILVGWSAYPALQNGVFLGAGTIEYPSSATAARTILASAPNDWVITDGGVGCALPVSVELSSATASSTNEADGTFANFPRLLVNGTVGVGETVELDITGGTATSGGTDYTSGADPIVINIPAGVYDGLIGTSVAITLPSVDDDSLVEGDETVTFSLINPSSGAVIGDANGNATTQSAHTYTIIDDDVASVGGGGGAGFVYAVPPVAPVVPSSPLPSAPEADICFLFEKYGAIEAMISNGPNTRQKITQIALALNCDPIDLIDSDMYQKIFNDVNYLAPSVYVPVIETALQYEFVTPVRQFFEPGKIATRAETFAIIMSATCLYDRTPWEEKWQPRLYQEAFALGITNRTWGEFNPNGPITKGELRNIVLRVIQKFDSHTLNTCQ